MRVSYADQGLNRIDDSITDEHALLVGDVLATGFWAAKISEIGPRDTVVILGGGSTGILSLIHIWENPGNRKYKRGFCETSKLFRSDSYGV